MLTAYFFTSEPGLILICPAPKNESSKVNEPYSVTLEDISNIDPSIWLSIEGSF